MRLRIKRPRVYYLFLASVISISLFIRLILRLLPKPPEKALSAEVFYNSTMGKYGLIRVLDELCIEDGCYVIRDMLSDAHVKKPPQRQLIEKESQTVRASVTLHLPKLKIPSLMDTKKWGAVREYFMPETLERAVIEAALLGGGLSTNTSRTVSVLIIGIGSGAVANFIQYNYFMHSFIKILEKHEKMARFLMDWFEIAVRQELQILLGDELETLGKLAHDGERFNVVFYNMCPLSMEGHPCPSTRALPERSIRDIIKLLEPSGVFIASLMTESVDATSSYNKVCSAVKATEDPDVVDGQATVFRKCTRTSYNLLTHIVRPKRYLSGGPRRCTWTESSLPNSCRSMSRYVPDKESLQMRRDVVSSSISTNAFC